MIEVSQTLACFLLGELSHGVSQNPSRCCAVEIYGVTSITTMAIAIVGIHGGFSNRGHNVAFES